MKLTRKQLNQILSCLPDPILAETKKILPVIVVPVHEDLIVYSSGDVSPIATTRIRELTFYYSETEMDWVLKDLDI